ncbi:MAG: NAD(P)/FAD-dependent oxidoreductase [Patescibacteria group bacterium]
MIKKSYDIIIIGASIAGLEAAKSFGNKNLKILILDKSKEVGEKVCAHGVTINDIDFIPDNYLNFPYQRALLHYKNKTISFPGKVGFVSSIDRKEFLESTLNSIKKYSNIEIFLDYFVQKINKDYIIVNDKKIEYSYLIGADGSNSIVRKYLNLPTKKIEFAIQYIVPRVYKEFELFLGDNRFGAGYAWIFPNKKFTSIGCGSDTDAVSPKKLKENFENWLKEKDLNIDNAKLEMSIINYDYRGYHFDNIYLIGDAAGLASGFTGKGMYSALASAIQVADEILKVKKDTNLILDWVDKKKAQEKIIPLLKIKVIRGIVYFLGLKILPKLENRVLKYL